MKIRGNAAPVASLPIQIGKKLFLRLHDIDWDKALSIIRLYG